MAEDNGMQDQVADYDGEGQEWAAREGGDSRVVMMAMAVEDGGGGRRRQRRKMIVVEDNGMQDQVADYNREGQEWAAREGGDSRVVMMAVAVEDGGSGRQRRRWTMIVTEDNGMQDRVADCDGEG